MLKNDTTFNTFQKLINNQYFDSNIDNSIDNGLSQVDLNYSELLPNQYYYIVRTKDIHLSYISPEVEHITGYTQSEWYPELLRGSIHPEDRSIIDKAIREAYNIGQQVDKKLDSSFVFKLNYRIKRKDGEYIPVLRYSSLLKKDKTGKMLYYKTIITDLSGIKKDNTIDVKFYHKNKIIYSLNNNKKLLRKELLSKRENEIVYYMFNNVTSEEIAEKLCLSKHTVDTHRRNILKKLEIKNTMDLILNMVLV